MPPTGVMVCVCLVLSCVGGGLLGYGVYQLRDSEDWADHSNRTFCEVLDYSKSAFSCSRSCSSNYALAEEKNSTEVILGKSSHHSHSHSRSCYGEQWTYKVVASDECGSRVFSIEAACSRSREYDIGEIAPCYVHDGCTKARFVSPSESRIAAIVILVFGSLLSCPVVILMFVGVALCVTGCVDGVQGASIFRRSTKSSDYATMQSPQKPSTGLMGDDDDAESRPYYGTGAGGYPSAPAAHDGTSSAGWAAENDDVYPPPADTYPHENPYQHSSAPGVYGEAAVAGTTTTTATYGYSYGQPQGTGNTQEGAMPAY